MTVELLAAENFDRAVSENEILALEFGNGTPGMALVQAARARPTVKFAHVDIAGSPSVAAMFAVNDGPTLLVFRQRIVVHLESREHSASQIEALIDRVQALDMDALRMAIQAERQAEEALVMRRVCPTARRTRDTE